MTAGYASAAALIKQANHPIALTGAGISTPSGIPDFRSTRTGLWQRYDPLEAASIAAFKHNPENFYKWFHPLATAIYAAAPNPAHIALARLQQTGNLHEIITQNIDPLHQRAGARGVLQVHGNLDWLTCLCCGGRSETKPFLHSYLKYKIPPTCPQCSQVLKPEIVLYGEMLPADVWVQAEEAVARCDLFLIIGSSLEVAPASGLPMLALKNRVKLIVINHEPTYVDPRAAEVIHLDVAQALPGIVENVLKKTGSSKRPNKPVPDADRGQ